MRRALAAFVALGLGAGLVIGAPPALAQEPPVFTVDPGNEFIEGARFAPNGTASIERNGQPFAEVQLDDTGYFYWGGDPMSEEDNIAVGDVVTITDSAFTTKAHTVTGARITGVEGSVVSGVADGDRASVWVADSDPWIQRGLDDQVPGNWSVTLGEPGTQPGDQGTGTPGPGWYLSMEDLDEDGDGTQADYQVPSPECHANLTYGSIDGWDIGTGITITVTAGQATKSWSGDRVETWDGNFSLWLDPSEWILAPGQVVTCAGSMATKELTVSDIKVTGWDLGANTISGTAIAGGMIGIEAGPDWNPVRLETRPDAGAWSVDFGTAVDLRIGDQVWVEQSDADWDNTRVRVTLAPPRLVLQPLLQQIVGGGWRDGATVTLTIDNPATRARPDLTRTTTAGRLCTDAPDCPSWMVPSIGGENVFFDLVGGPVLAHPGDTVIMTDGVTTKTLVVPALTANAGDPDARTYTGTATAAAPGGYLSVTAGGPSEGCGTVQDVTPDATGTWALTVAGDCELVRDASARWVDPDGDQAATMNPSEYLKVHPNTDRVWASWPRSATLTLTITRSGPEVLREQATTQNVLNREHWDYDMWALAVGDLALPMMARWDLAGRFDIRAGDVLSVTDGVTTHSITVDALTVDSVSASTDTVTGTATQPVGLRIVNEGDQGYWGYGAEPDVSGHWSYTFTPGVFPNPPDGLAPGMIGRAFVNDTIVRWLVPAEGIATATTITRDAPDPSTAGQAYTVTVRVARTGSGSGRPLGSVVISDGVVGSCTDTTSVKVDSRTSQFSCALRTRTLGTITLKATFVPAAGWQSSTGMASHLVKRAPR